MVLTKDWKQEDLVLGLRVKIKDVIEDSLLANYFPQEVLTLVRNEMKSKKYTLTEIRYCEENPQRVELLRLAGEDSYTYVYNLDLIDGIYI